MAAGDDLARALDRLEGSGEPWLPVVLTRDDRRVIGVLRLADVLVAYNRALLQVRVEERGEEPPAGR